MNLYHRAEHALSQLRDGTKPEGRPAAEHVLALALETMFRTGDSRCYLTTTEVERYVGHSGNHNGSRIIRRVLDTGALVEITDANDVDTFRVALEESAAPFNARVVTLPRVAIEGGMSGLKEAPHARIEGRGGVAIEGADNPDVASIEGATGVTDAAIEGQITVTTEETTSPLSVSVEEYVAGMQPRSRVWKGGDLGSGAARIYGVVVNAHRPVTAGDVCLVLNGSSHTGNRGAKNMLRSLSKHGLVVRSHTGNGWLPGNTTPATHEPAVCGGCTPSRALHPTPAENTRQRGAQGQESTPVPDLVLRDRSLDLDSTPAPKETDDVAIRELSPVPGTDGVIGWEYRSMLPVYDQTASDCFVRPLVRPDGLVDVTRMVVVTDGGRFKESARPSNGDWEPYWTNEAIEFSVIA